MSSNKVKLIKNRKVDPDYGFDVIIDDDQKGCVVGIDDECGLLFKARIPLRDFELIRISEALKSKSLDLMNEGLL
jgi:hypothetical protein